MKAAVTEDISGVLETTASTDGACSVGATGANGVGTTGACSGGTTGADGIGADSGVGATGAGGVLINCLGGPETGRLLTMTGLRVRDVTAINGRPVTDTAGPATDVESASLLTVGLYTVVDSGP